VPHRRACPDWHGPAARPTAAGEIRTSRSATGPANGWSSGNATRPLRTLSSSATWVPLTPRPAERPSASSTTRH